MKLLKPNTSSLKPSLGFTLIEIVIAMAIVAILTIASLIIINPASRLAKTRNDQRTLNVNVILNAVGQNIANNSGTFTCPAGLLPTTTPQIIGSSTYDIYDCLIPEFMSSMPVDPITGTTGTSSADYDTAYEIVQNSTTSQITITAPDTELCTSDPCPASEAISVTR